MKYSNISTRIGIAAALLALAVLASPSAGTAQISVVVAGSSSHTASEAEIVDMFVGARTTWRDGTRVQIVDQPDTDVGRSFYDSFVRQSVAQVRTQWTRLVLSGQAQAPKKVNDASAVKRALAETPGAIGYIPTTDLDDSVREIARIN